MQIQAQNISAGFNTRSAIILYAIIIGVPLGALLAVVLLGSPLFESNDDTGLSMLGAGFGLAVEPEPHLIFSHFGYGVLLNVVSRFAGPNAHGWTTLAALGLSMGLFARALCARLPASLQGSQRGSLQLSLCIPACALIAGIGCVFVRATLDPQFTITASLLFAAAIGCWLALLRNGARSPGLATVIYGALVLSFLIRPSAAMLGLIVVGPGLVWLAWLGPKESRQPTCRMLAGLAALGLLIFLTDKAAYAFSANWRDAIEYNQIRSLFNDYYRIPWIPGAPEYAKVGWSANDHAMFMMWYSLHPIFDYENIKYLAQTLLLQAPLLVLSGVRGWLTTLKDSPLLISLAVVQLLSCVLPSRHRIFIVLVTIGILAALIFSGLTGRPPLFRVQFSAFGIAALCTLPCWLDTENGSNLFRKLASGLLVAVGLFAGTKAVHVHEERVVEAVAYRAKLSEVKPYFSGMVVSWRATLMWEWLITPTKVYASLDRVTVPSIGLFTKMPVMSATLRRLGIKDLGAALCTEPDVSLIALASDVAMLQIFCERHYHSRPSYKLVFSYPPTEIYVSAQPEPR